MGQQKPARLLNLRDGIMGHQDTSIELESNRPIDPLSTNAYYWEQWLVRRGHPLRQLAVMVATMSIQATLVHLTLLIHPVAFLVYVALWIVITVMCGVGVMGNTRLVAHAVTMWVILVCGAIVGIL